MVCVDREWARADRSDDVFSIVVFSAEQPRSSRPIGAILADRARASDVIGSLDAETFGVLLPSTGGQEAWVLADDVQTRGVAKGLDCECKVYAYEQANSNEEDERSSGDGESPNGDGGTIDRRNGDGKGRRATAPLWDARVASGPPWRCVEDLRPELVQQLPAWRRVLDVVVACTLIFLLAPLFLVVALAIKLNSPGPVIFCQQRAGKGGRPFTMYKFRSMTNGAERLKEGLRDRNEAEGPVFKIRDDPRMTAVGRLLRKTSIDELPQLWNVLCGDMTLIGPRPPTLDEVPYYQPWQRRRLSLTGGLTCIWQVSGRSNVKFDDWVRMDVRYAQRRSLLMDFGLLTRTVWAVLSCRGAR